MRDDDVLVHSSSMSDEDCFRRFKQIHEWIVECPGMLHVPTLVIEELKDFPRCIDYLVAETEAGRMLPEFHCMWHSKDYAQLPDEHVREHLFEGAEWMQDVFGSAPRYWYTPWGADNERLRSLAKEACMQLEGVDRERSVRKVCERVIKGRLDVPRHGEFWFHWWEKGASVKRLALMVTHGSLEAAKAADPELFRD